MIVRKLIRLTLIFAKLMIHPTGWFNLPLPISMTSFYISITRLEVVICHSTQSGGIPNLPAALVTEMNDSGEYWMYLHSSQKYDNVRNFEIEIRISVTGQVSLCTDDSRRSIVAGYEICQ